jgi:PAS domain S-box-containing protein
VRRPDGSTRRCLVHGSPLFDARGQRVGAVGIWTDITRRHEAEEALRVSEVVINGSAEIISVVDGQMTYHMVNDAWCKATGVARDRALGRRAPVVLPGVITPAWNEALQRCLDSQQPDELAVVLKLGDAPERHLLTSFYPVTTGSQRLAALVTRDVTQDVVQRSALITSAEYLRGTLDATGDAIFATDADALDEPARFANDQLLRLWGLPLALRAALTSRHVLERIRSLVDEPDRVERQMDDIVAAGVPAEYRLTLRDGRIVQMRFACMTLAGRKLRVWSGRDVTTESRAVMAREATLAEQRALLEKFPGYIAVIDGDNRYLHVNDRLARLFRRPADDVVGRTGAEVLGEQRWRKVRQALDQTRRVGTAISDSQYASEDGQSQLDLEVTHIAGPRHADGSQLVYSFGIDVTERKRAQAALIDALAEAERANKAKSQFLSNMSHELRTPLNAVLGFGQLLANRPLDDEQRHQVAEILRGGRHLLGLINDLLDLGRIEAGELEVVCEGVDAHDAIAQSLGLMQPLALERDVVLRHRDGDSPPALAWADPKRLRQVLLNLVSNAIKYNQPGGVVVVESEAIGDVVEFRVRDSGPGLSAEQQQRLFRPFERLDAGRGNVDGTGIGLALSRYLVDAMGGRIGVHSEPGRGSTFWFRLRLSGQPAPVALPGAAAAACGAPPHRALHRGQPGQPDADVGHARGRARPGGRGRPVQGPGQGLHAATRADPAGHPAARHRRLRGAAPAARRPAHRAHAGGGRQRQRHACRPGRRPRRRLRRLPDQAGGPGRAADHAAPAAAARHRGLISCGPVLLPAPPMPCPCCPAPPWPPCWPLPCRPCRPPRPRCGCGCWKPPTCT